MRIYRIVSNKQLDAVNVIAETPEEALAKFRAVTKKRNLRIFSVEDRGEVLV